MKRGTQIVFVTMAKKTTARVAKALGIPKQKIHTILQNYPHLRLHEQGADDSSSLSRRGDCSPAHPSCRTSAHQEPQGPGGFS